MSLLTSKLGTYKSLALGRTDLWEEKKLQALNNGKALRFAFRAYLAHHLEVKSTIYRFAQPSCEWHRVYPMRQLKIVSLIRKYKLNRMYDNLHFRIDVYMYRCQSFACFAESRKFKINHYLQVSPSSPASCLRQSGRNCWAFRPLWERLLNRWTDSYWIQLTYPHLMSLFTQCAFSCPILILVQLFTQQGLGSENERLRQDIDTLRSHLQEAVIKWILAYVVICCNQRCRMLVTCVKENYSVSDAAKWSREHQADSFTASV